MGHFCGTLGTLLRDTLVGTLADTLMGLLQGTLVALAGRSCTLLQDTLVGHSCGALLWDTLKWTLLTVGHGCGTLLWDTEATHVWNLCVRGMPLPAESVPNECPTGVSHKSVPQQCPARVSYKSVP